MPEDMKDKGMAEEDAVPLHAFTFKQRQSYPIISLISHPSEIMLRVIFSPLKAKAEELLAEQAGFRPGRSTVLSNC